MRANTALCLRGCGQSTVLEKVGRGLRVGVGGGGGASDGRKDTVKLQEGDAKDTAPRLPVVAHPRGGGGEVKGRASMAGSDSCRQPP